MSNEEENVIVKKQVELVAKFSKVLEENEHLYEALLPALNTILATSIKVNAEKAGDIALDSHIFAMMTTVGKDEYAIVTVDFDIMPLLSHLDALGEPDLGIADVVPIHKGIEEDMGKPEGETLQ